MTHTSSSSERLPSHAVAVVEEAEVTHDKVEELAMRHIHRGSTEVIREEKSDMTQEALQK